MEQPEDVNASCASPCSPVLREVAKLLHELPVGSTACEDVMRRGDIDVRFASVVTTDRAIKYALQHELIRPTQVQLIRRNRERWFFEKTMKCSEWTRQHETLMPGFRGYMDGSAGY